MTAKTIAFARETLEKQRAHIATETQTRGRHAGQVQEAYYQGMQAMLDLVLSEAFTQPIPAEIYADEV